MRGSSVLSAALRSGTSDEISLPMSSVIPDFLTNPLVGSTRSKSKHHRLCVCVCVFAEELLLFDAKTLTFDLQAAASWCLTVVYSSDDFSHMISLSRTQTQHVVQWTRVQVWEQRFDSN